MMMMITNRHGWIGWTGQARFLYGVPWEWRGAERWALGVWRDADEGRGGGSCSDTLRVVLYVFRQLIACNRFLRFSAVLDADSRSSGEQPVTAQSHPSQSL
jgi:hypothetical protein